MPLARINAAEYFASASDNVDRRLATFEYIESFLAAGGREDVLRTEAFEKVADHPTLKSLIFDNQKAQVENLHWLLCLQMWRDTRLNNADTDVFRVRLVDHLEFVDQVQLARLRHSAEQGNLPHVT